MVTIARPLKAELHKSINYSIVTSTLRLQATTNYWLNASLKGHRSSAVVVYAAVWTSSESANAESTKHPATGGFSAHPGSVKLAW